MKKEIRQRLTHALTAMLLTAGVLMPLLGVMERSFLNPRMLIASAVMIILFEIVTIHRISSLIAAALVVPGKQRGAVGLLSGDFHREAHESCPI